MDGNQFDDLVRRFSRREIGRRQLVIGSLALAVGGAGASPLALAQDAAPSPTPASIQGQPGDSRQQFPCPPQPTGPFNPFDWICGTGPFDPWYPVIAPPDITAATGIRWYGVQGLETGGLRVAAFDRANREISHYESAPADDGLRWTIADATTSLDGFFNAPRVDGSLVEISGEINGVPFQTAIGPDGLPTFASDQPAVRDELEQFEIQELVSRFTFSVGQLDPLLELALTSGEDPLEASEVGCFAAGYLLVATAPLCFLGGPACLPAAGATSYIVGKCTDSW